MNAPIKLYWFCDAAGDLRTEPRAPKFVPYVEESISAVDRLGERKGQARFKYRVGFDELSDRVHSEAYMPWDHVETDRHRSAIVENLLRACDVVTLEVFSEIRDIERKVRR